MKIKKLKIAVIGAGPSGLCCAKHALDYGHDVIVYEQTSKIGGQWAYTDEVGHDEFDNPIHSSMYKSVVTNLPVDFMRFFDHPFPRLEPSFVSHEDILAYLQSYSDKFDLDRVIQFQHQVVNVRPLPEDRWEIFSKDLKANICETKQFDAIFVCTGHYHVPFIPQFDGLDKFVGRKMHSHDYRQPDRHKDEIVLIIGAGPSGIDIAIEIATEAKQVIWSNHNSLCNFTLPANVKNVGDVKCFDTHSVQLMSGDEEQITCVLFCTGYTNSFPFLSIDCGLSLKGRFEIDPLYKEMININYPTMAIIALSTCILTYLRHDLQARTCLKFWSGEITIPSRKEMLKELESENEKYRSKGFLTRANCGPLVKFMSEYMDDLSELSQMKKVPPVFTKIFLDFFDLEENSKKSRRDFNYTILDDETFERKPISKCN